MPDCHNQSCQMMSRRKSLPTLQPGCALVPLLSTSRAHREGRSDGWWINQSLLVPDVPNPKWWMRKSGPCESVGIHRPPSGLYLCATLDLRASAVMRPVKWRPCPPRRWKGKNDLHILAHYESHTTLCFAFTASPLPHKLLRSSKTLPSSERLAQTGRVIGEETEWRNRWFFFWPVKNSFHWGQNRTHKWKKIN